MDRNDQFRVTLDKLDGLGKQLVKAAEEAVQPTNHLHGPIECFVFVGEQQHSAFGSAFDHAQREPQRPMSEPNRRVGNRSYGPSYTQVGDDIDTALFHTQAVLVAVDDKHVHLLCSDDALAFFDLLVNSMDPAELLENFHSTGRFDCQIVNAIV